MALIEGSSSPAAQGKPRERHLCSASSWQPAPTRPQLLSPHNSSATVPSACGTHCCVIQTFLYRIFANRICMWRHVLVQHNTSFRSKYFMLQLLKDSDLAINATCLFIFCHSYRACSYSRYTNKQMHSIKYNSWKISNSYMFRHRGAILRDSSRTKELQVQQAHLRMEILCLSNLCILKF